MNVKESEKVGLKLNIQKTKIMASGPITSWEIYGETVEMPEKESEFHRKRNSFCFKLQSGKIKGEKSPGMDTDIATNVKNKGLIFSICKQLINIAKKSSNIQKIGKGYE